MKAIVSALAVAVLGGLGFLVMALPTPAFALVTSTIIGWNFPNGTTLNNGLEILIFPLVVMGVFVALPLAFQRKGDFVVTMALLGMLVGSLFGLLTITLSGTGSNGVIPFGVAVETGLLFALWMWKGGG